MRQVTVSCVTDHALIAREEETTEEIISRMIDQWSQHIKQVLPDKPDLIVLPEVCDRPRVGSISAAKQMEIMKSGNTQFLDFAKKVARENNLYMIYPTYRKGSEGKIWNSCSVIDREGKIIGSYDKNHLVEAENMDLGVNYSNELLILDLDFGRVAFIICFDLNFTELLERYRHKGIEMVIFVSEYHGGLMQNYWAYQLRSYFVSSIRPPALSTVVSPLGEVVAKTTNYHNYIVYKLNLDFFVIHLDENWPKLKLLKEKYRDGIQIYDPGNLGAVLVSIESDSLTARGIIDEFGFLLLDDYLQRARGHRSAAISSAAK